MNRPRTEAAQDVSITVLAENTVHRRGLLAEHGLSIWIETPDAQVLFDTGQGLALPNNVARLKIPIDQASAIALSHGHYDHCGGLGYLLQENKAAPIYLHPDALQPRFSRHADQQMHAIGMPVDLASALEAVSERITQTLQPTRVAADIWATGPIPRVTDFEDTGGEFYLDAQGVAPDPIRDDQALWLETSKGIVVVLGCAHSGVVNTLQFIADLTGARGFHAVLGGMHLGRASPKRLAATAAALDRYGVSRLGPMHCTGMTAAVFLAEHSPGRLESCGVGEKLVV